MLCELSVRISIGTLF